MRRKLFSFFSAVSLLLCIAVCVLWARSFYIGDRYYRGDADGTQTYLHSGRGLLCLERSWGNPLFTRVGTAWSSAHNPPYPLSNPRQTGLLKRLGFWTIAAQTSQGPFRIWVVPYWAAALSLAAMPGLWLLKARRGRSLQGLCPQCGYDLRATPERCPECGAVPVAR